MVAREEFARKQPELAASVPGCFAVRTHCTLATLRRDGSPRISGTEVEFADGALWLGMMAGVAVEDGHSAGAEDGHRIRVDITEAVHTRWARPRTTWSSCRGTPSAARPAGRCGRTSR